MIGGSREARQAVAFVAAICGLAALAVMMSPSHGRVVLLRDPDEPTEKEMMFAGHHVKGSQVLRGHTGEFSMPYNKLANENRRLEGQVEVLQKEVKSLLGQRKSMGHHMAANHAQLGKKVLTPHTAKSAAPLEKKRAATQGLSEAGALNDLSTRMEWAKAELKDIQRGRDRHVVQHKLSTPHKVSLSAQPKHKLTSLSYGASQSDGPWAIVQHNGYPTEALTTPEGDDNPIAALKPGDYWLDPSERPFLHAPQPHDPSSTLIHTVTGDYASPATWGQIYHVKQNIDWCVSYFPFFEDRMKCITKLHAEGPLLG